MANRIRLDNWDAVTDELRQFGTAGDITTGDDWIRLDFGTAHVEVSQKGHVSAGMPLHDFEHGGEIELVVDHEAGSLTIETAEVSYTFRRPRG